MVVKLKDLKVYKLNDWEFLLLSSQVWPVTKKVHSLNRKTDRMTDFWGSKNWNITRFIQTSREWYCDREAEIGKDVEKCN